MKKLTIRDKTIIERVVNRFLPFSDFNYTSLFVWDVKNQTYYKLINGNLLIKFFDYITGRPIYSLVGSRNIERTFEEIFNLYHIDKLEMVPEKTVRQLHRPKLNYEIVQCRDHYDYIYSIKDFLTFSGKHFGSKRNGINRLIKQYGGRITSVKIDIKHKDVKSNILKIFEMWERKKGVKRSSSKNELIALERLLKYSRHFNLVAVGIFVDGKMIGFSIAEKVQYKYAIIHFEKADPDYYGVYEFITQQISIQLSNMGCKYVNWEQDLGLEGLRVSKLSYKPLRFLKKFSIKLINNG